MIVAELAARGDLVDQKPHEMIIGRCQRSNDILEPRLKTQWFVRTGPLAEWALDATRSGRTRILPERFEKTWEHWLTDIRDWNVSRQLWWGHRIPAWYCPDGHVTVSAGEDGPTTCDVCGRPAVELERRTRTSSTPGSARACGRSRPWAGPTKRPTMGPTTRRRSWRPVTTSSSSGSRHGRIRRPRPARRGPTPARRARDPDRRAAARSRPSNRARTSRDLMRLETSRSGTASLWALERDDVIEQVLRNALAEMVRVDVHDAERDVRLPGRQKHEPTAEGPSPRSRRRRSGRGRGSRIPG